MTPFVQQVRHDEITETEADEWVPGVGVLWWVRGWGVYLRKGNERCCVGLFSLDLDCIVYMSHICDKMTYN